ncbi:hypothetical protein MNBD_BACTEROID03-802 [hydrothermal vent metagenome]|uniref:Uncharacterized protein n=1 Tax=hydrothermal vent metagenome TaxID=652676 RepID=A0A3B0T9W9_9ZZZZ
MLIISILRLPEHILDFWKAFFCEIKEIMPNGLHDCISRLIHFTLSHFVAIFPAQTIYLVITFYPIKKEWRLNLYFIIPIRTRSRYNPLKTS